MAPLKSIKDFGYDFNAEGRLRRVDKNTGLPGAEPFQFNVSDNHQECQKHYEELGDAITEYVYQLLERDEKLQRLPVPTDSVDDLSTFIFASKDYEKKARLIVLIHGSGVVRAGQWARSLIINDSLKSGTQIPYIQKAKEDDFGIIILNTNDNTRDTKQIHNSGSPEEHSDYVWETYIKPTQAASIVIVAHSYGGVVVLHLANKFKEEFENRVKAVAFTDSVHGYSQFRVSKHLKEVGRNWVASSDPLDTFSTTPDHDVQRVSAGHTKHEMTSYSALQSVFKFINDKIQ